MVYEAAALFSQAIFQHRYELSVACLLLLWLAAAFGGAKQHTGFRIVLLVTAGAYQAAYILWRIFFTLPLHAGPLSIVCGIALVSAELLGAWQSTVLGLFSLKKYQPSQAAWRQDVPLPQVDILVPTYNEPMALLRKTLVACKNMEYPERLLHICLCDDGGRPEARALCDELGVRYITRKERSFAKAGNLNHALTQSTGAFFALFDADMVPKPNFLKETIGYFSDPNVGFVQTPQAFYSPDPFQFNLKFYNRIPNEQDFFMREIQESRAHYNAVLHVGTNAVFRRKAMDAIGGIPTGTITEDIATGLLIQAKGYTSVFVNKILAVGLAVDRFSDLIRQRERWCRGNIQVSKKWNVLRLPGLCLWQRLIYLNELIYWLFGVQKMIYILSPLLYLVCGLTILNATPCGLLMLWLPAFAGLVLSFRSFRYQNRKITWSHIYEVAMSPYLAVTFLAEWLIGKPGSFHVTPKGRTAKRAAFSWHMALPHIALFALTVLGWALAFWRVRSGGCSGTAIQAIAINTVWSVYNMAAIVAAILVCFERPHLRTAERISGHAAVLLTAADRDEPIFCGLLDLSETGMRLKYNTPGLRDGEQVWIDFPYAADIRATVVRCQTQKDRSGEAALRFTDLSAKQYAGIIRCLTGWSNGYFHTKVPSSLSTAPVPSLGLQQDAE